MRKKELLDWRCSMRWRSGSCLHGIIALLGDGETAMMSRLFLGGRTSRVSKASSFICEYLMSDDIAL